MTERAFMACEVCHRVIWVEDGPICVYCRNSEQEEPTAEEEAE